MGACCSSKYDTVTPIDDDAPPRRRVHADGISNGFTERFGLVEGTHNVKLKYEKLCSINSAAYLPTGDIVLSDCVNNKLKLFTCNFDYINCLEFPTPVDYVCSSPNLPLVYCCFPDRVRQIHIDGSVMKRSGFIKTPGHCRAMCVNKFDGKAISLNMPDGNGQVNLLTPGGNLQLEMNEDEDGDDLFVQPGPLVVTRDLDIVVIDKGANVVIGVQPDGEVIFTYKGVRSPSALVCDELNYLYVSGPLNIHQLTSTGELVKLFLTKAEIGFSPLGMCYNEQKRQLLAVGKGAKVTLFKMT